MPQKHASESQRRNQSPLTAARSTKPSRRRAPLNAALDLTIEHSFADAVRIATNGGLLTVDLRNTGLAPSFQAYVELSRVIYRLRSTSGLFVFQTRDNGPSFWRRAGRGEILPPDSIVTPRAGSRGLPLEGFISDDPQDRRTVIASITPAGSLAPRESISLSIDLPAMSVGVESEGVWSWCVVARCFDVLQEPPVPLVLPTPQQAAHHTRLMCLHDTIE